MHIPVNGTIERWRNVSNFDRPSGYYGPGLRFYSGGPGDLIRDLRKDKINAVVLSDWEGRFRAEGYKREISLYEAIKKEFRVVARFEDEIGHKNIILLRKRPLDKIQSAL